jgi:hypothetical protein
MNSELILSPAGLPVVRASLRAPFLTLAFRSQQRWMQRVELAVFGGLGSYFALSLLFFASGN